MIYLAFRTDSEMEESDELFDLFQSFPCLVNVVCENKSSFLLVDLAKQLGCNEHHRFKTSCLKNIIYQALNETDFLLFGLAGIEKREIFILMSELLIDEKLEMKKIVFLYNSFQINQNGIEEIKNFNSFEDFQFMLSKYEEKEPSTEFVFKRINK